MPPTVWLRPATPPSPSMRPWLPKPRPQRPWLRGASPPKSVLPPPAPAGSTRCIANWLNRLPLAMPGCAEAACAACAAKPPASPLPLRRAAWCCCTTLPMLPTSALSARRRLAWPSPRSAPACCAITSRSANCNAPSSGLRPASWRWPAVASARPRPSLPLLPVSCASWSKPGLAVSDRPSAVWLMLKLSNELWRGRNTSPPVMLAV
ncbi:hypothetical protein SRABI122_03496 [Stenotrophomonas lactitubi]|nr:hypothetical protein SRABI122_03496 [Stenotrophomonas lactitubi]